VSEPKDAPLPYQVVYSEQVKAALREQASQAAAVGKRPAIIAAVKELDRLLHLYPQFGEPLMDLMLEDGRLWHGTVGPLVVRYAIYEERRLVMVAVPPVLLQPRSGG
jgi:hypothetical protein